MAESENVRREIVARFGEGLVPDVEAALSRDDVGARVAVLIAVVKLSDGDVDRLLTFAQAANQDYRDVLYWSEYPPTPEEPERLRVQALELIEQQRHRRGRS